MLGKTFSGPLSAGEVPAPGRETSEAGELPGHGGEGRDILRALISYPLYVLTPVPGFLHTAARTRDWTPTCDPLLRSRWSPNSPQMEAPDESLTPTSAAVMGERRGWLARIGAAFSAAAGVVAGIAPHVLHHAGPIAGAALLAGAGGTLLFG